MIDELKILLDMLGNVDNIALYVLAGFTAYKLIIYLSTTGAIVMLLKLAINKIHHAITNDRTVYHMVNFNDIFIRKSDIDLIMSVMKRYSSTDYIHEDDTRRIIEALEAGRMKKK